MTASASNTGRIERVALHGGFRPLPTQLEFCRSPYRLKAYIGPMGSGKSEIVCRATLDLLTRVPDSRGVIGRYTLKDFKRTTLETLHRVMPPQFVQRQLPGGEGWILRTPDRDRPSTLLAGHYDEAQAYASMGLLVWAIDEVNGDSISPSVPESVFQMLDARLGRDQNPKARPYGLMGGNPAGHNWVWRLFHPQSPSRLAEAWMFTPKPYENASNLPADYYEGLERRNGPEWVARYVHGSHDTVEGAVYPELNDRDHAVNPFEIPPTWPRVIAMDYGFTNPTCVVFAAVDQDGRIFCYDEHYQGDDKRVSWHATQIKQRLPAMAKAREVTWVADPSIFGDRDTWKDGKIYRISDEYADAGLDQWQPGENDVAAGRNRVKEYLATGKLKFFRGRLPNVWREMQGLHWRRFRTLEERNAPEEEADVDNHGPDTLRYLVMSRPEPAEVKVAKRVPTVQELQIARVHRHIVAAQKRASAPKQKEEDYV